MPEARKVARFPRNESILTGKLYVLGRKGRREGKWAGACGKWLAYGLNRAVAKQ